MGKIAHQPRSGCPPAKGTECYNSVTIANAEAIVTKSEHPSPWEGRNGRAGERARLACGERRPAVHETKRFLATKSRAQGGTKTNQERRTATRQRRSSLRKRSRKCGFLHFGRSEPAKTGFDERAAGAPEFKLGFESFGMFLEAGFGMGDRVPQSEIAPVMARNSVENSPGTARTSSCVLQNSENFPAAASNPGVSARSALKWSEIAA